MVIEYIVGIDPGLSGAISVVPLSREAALPVAAYYMPTLSPPARLRKAKAIRKTEKRTKYDIAGIRRILRRVLKAATSPDRVVFVIEDVSARFGDGIVQAFAFGFGAGMLSALVVGLGHGQKPAMILPNEWRPFMVGANTDKAASVKLARKLYRSIDFSLVKSEALAEALLIATYAAKDLPRTLSRREAWPLSPEAIAFLAKPVKKKPKKKPTKKVLASSPTRGRKVSSAKKSPKRPDSKRRTTSPKNKIVASSRRS